MRRWSLLTFYLGLLLSAADAQAVSGAETPSADTGAPQTATESPVGNELIPRVAEDDSAVAPPDVIGPPSGQIPADRPQATSSQSANATDGLDPTCQTLQSAAEVNDLPLAFLTRLIWQESRFDSRAVSRAGALGIAQFMPKTASWVGLVNPFDTVDAIIKSAQFLRSLRAQFGNLGLAAAAYNAGPGRVQDWLAKRRSLPRETEAYVRIVTGHAAVEWTTARLSDPDIALPEAVPCPQIVKLLVEGRANKKSGSTASAGNTAGPPSAPLPPAWAVQLVGDSSEVAALSSFYQLQRTYKGVLGSATPLVVRTPLGRSGYWYRVRVAADTLGAAEKLCTSLRAAGGTCLVQRN